MVSELHARKTALEAKLAEKNRELKLLCIEEYKLTGVLPPEIPLEPGESPPVIPRRVGTSFAFPENLINNTKLKSNEDDVVASLESEYELQSKIVDAARTLASDGTVTKSVRRKLRARYQESQNKLLDLEARLNTLRQPHNVSKQRKKPRPPLENEEPECDITGVLNGPGVSLSPPPVSQDGQGGWEPPHHHEPFMRHSNTHDGIALPSSRHTQSLLPPTHPNLLRYGSGGPFYYGGLMVQHQYSTLSSCAHSELDRCRGRLEHTASTPGYWLRYEATDTETTWTSTAPRQMPRFAHSFHHQLPQEQLSRGSDRFTGSLDRRKLPPVVHTRSNPSPSAGIRETDIQHHTGEETSLSRPYPQREMMVNSPTVETLLPGQTYPEHGLVRAQSLGSVEASKKPKEKEWYETSLDATPTLPQRQPKADVSSDAGSNLSRSSSNVSNERRPPLHARSHEISSQENFDTVVPFESPKNHTVVQAGKWQPYREVTKPFEMSDFYKYSTKFKKNENAKQMLMKQTKNNATGKTNPPPVHQSPTLLGSSVPVPTDPTANPDDQQKGVYQPPKPMTCKPLDPNMKNLQERVPLDENFSAETLAWYQDQSLPRSATLV